MIEYKVKVYKNGTKEWYFNDELHREDGPAVESGNSFQWYFAGVRHREDGPAIEDVRGYKSYYLNGENLTEEEFNERMNPSPSCDGDVIVHNGKKYKLVLQK